MVENRAFLLKYQPTENKLEEGERHFFLLCVMFETENRDNQRCYFFYESQRSIDFIRYGVVIVGSLIHLLEWGIQKTLSIENLPKLLLLFDYYLEKKAPQEITTSSQCTK